MNNLVFPFVHKAKPILKWAGGKTQMLDVLIPLMPNQYCNYIEPFFGGGALFFAIQPQQAIISDTNPELINLYRVVSSQVEQLILELDKYYNDQDFFYEIRALKFENLDNVQAAARTIFLNKTCFNGLYRVNKKGEFNTPFGKYKNPNINDSATFCFPYGQTMTDTFHGETEGYFLYSRHWNPSNLSLCKALAAMEGTEAAWVPAVIGLVAAVAGGAMSYSAAQQNAQSQKDAARSVADAQEKSLNVQAAQTNEQAAQERRKQIREARIQRAQIENVE